MKKLLAVVLMIVTVLGLCGMCVAADDENIGIVATGDWHIFSKNMENDELLDAVGMSAREVNEVLENTGSDAILVNSKTNAVINVIIHVNSKSKELWNISETDNLHIMETLDDIMHNGFLIHDLVYDEQNVKISEENPYIKQIIVPGSVHSDGNTYGMVISGTIVNGKAIYFGTQTEGEVPTQEEIAELEEVTKSVEITKILQKGEEAGEEESKPNNLNRYLTGGAIVVIVAILGFVAMKKMKTDEDDEEKNEEEEE